MKKYYVIQDMIQTTENGKPLYWYGYYSNKNWTDKIEESRFYDSEDEIEWLVESDKKFNSIYQIITVFKARHSN